MSYAHTSVLSWDHATWRAWLDRLLQWRAAAGNFRRHGLDVNQFAHLADLGVPCFVLQELSQSEGWDLCDRIDRERRRDAAPPDACPELEHVRRMERLSESD